MRAKHHRQRVCRITIVIDEEHPRQGTQVSSRFGLRFVNGDFFAAQREVDVESAPFTHSLAVSFDAALMQFKEMFYKREPDSESALRACMRSLNLSKHAEYGLEHFWRDADARVFDCYHGFAARNFDHQFDDASVLRVLRRIVEQIGEYLTETYCVAAHV